MKQTPSQSLLYFFKSSSSIVLPNSLTQVSEILKEQKNTLELDLNHKAAQIGEKIQARIWSLMCVLLELQQLPR